jgi:hypothetical protein
MEGIFDPDGTCYLVVHTPYRYHVKAGIGEPVLLRCAQMRTASALYGQPGSRRSGA